LQIVARDRKSILTTLNLQDMTILLTIYSVISQLYYLYIQFTNYPFGYSTMLQMVSDLHNSVIDRTLIGTINRSSSTRKNRRFCNFTRSLSHSSVRI